MRGGRLIGSCCELEIYSTNCAPHTSLQRAYMNICALWSASELASWLSSWVLSQECHAWSQEEFAISRDISFTPFRVLSRTFFPGLVVERFQSQESDREALQLGARLLRYTFSIKGDVSLAYEMRLWHKAEVGVLHNKHSGSDSKCLSSRTFLCFQAKGAYS